MLPKQKRSISDLWMELLYDCLKQRGSIFCGISPFSAICCSWSYYSVKCVGNMIRFSSNTKK